MWKLWFSTIFDKSIFNDSVAFSGSASICFSASNLPGSSSGVACYRFSERLFFDLPIVLAFSFDVGDQTARVHMTLEASPGGMATDSGLWLRFVLILSSPPTPTFCMGQLYGQGHLQCYSCLDLFWSRILYVCVWWGMVCSSCPQFCSTLTLIPQAAEIRTTKAYGFIYSASPHWPQLGSSLGHAVESSTNQPCLSRLQFSDSPWVCSQISNPYLCSCSCQVQIFAFKQSPMLLASEVLVA